MGFITDSFAKAADPDVHKGDIRQPDPSKLENPNNHDLISGPDRPIYDKVKEASLEIKIDRIE